MTPERLEQIEEHDSPLTANELALGWHFCPEFDGMLTSGEPTNRDTPEALLICACGNKINPNTCITYEGEEPHGTRDTFVPPPVKCNDDFITEFEAALDKLTEESLSTTNNTMMTPSRWLQLTMNGGHITPLERMEGWHYCPRVDDKLTKIQNNICKLCGADQGPDPLDLVVCPTDEQLDQMQSIRDKANDVNKSDIELLKEKLISMDTITEIDLGGHTSESTIHQHDGKWWFWDETGMHRHGPYSSYEETRKDLNHYCHVYLGHPEDPS